MLLAFHKIIDHEYHIGAKNWFLSKTNAGLITKILITQYFVFLGWLLFRVGNPTELIYCIKKFIFIDFIFTPFQFSVVVLGVLSVAGVYVLSINTTIFARISKFITFEWVEYVGTAPKQIWLLYVLAAVTLLFWFAPLRVSSFIYFAF